MALIICPNCKKEISDSVQSCIHCGNPINYNNKPNLPQKKEKSKKKTIILIVVFVLFCIGAIQVMMEKAAENARTPEEKAQIEADQQQAREKREAENEADREKRREKHQAAQAEKRQAKIDQAIKITPSKLFREFKDNEVAANQKYKRKGVLMTAKISEITESITGKPEIAFVVGGYGLEKVSCTFPRDAQNQIAKLRKGQQITIWGEVGVFVLGSHLGVNDCDLIEYWE